MPESLRASIPPGILSDGENNVSVRINAGNADVPAIKKDYAGRLFNFEIEDDIYTDTEIIDQLQGTRIRVNASGRIFDIGKNVEAYKKTSPVFLVETDKDLLKKLNFLTGFGFQVHINMSEPPANKEILEKALEFYLHNPLLKTPIEPFHTILRTASTEAGYSLWDTEYEKIDANLYIGNDGRVSLSARWYKNDQVYGNLEDSWGNLQSSDLYKRLSSFRKILFREKSACIFCDHMDLCGGFLRAVDKDWPCDAWIKTFDILRQEVKSARDLLGEHQKE